MHERPGQYARAFVFHCVYLYNDIRYPTVMQLAVISDIHSNLQALEKALGAIRERGVDEVLCLGDLVGYGANPNECVKLVQEHCATVLLGNHDLAALEPSVAEQFTSNARIAALWTNKHLRPEFKDFLATLPYVAARQNMFLVHSSPYEPEEWHYIFSPAEARSMFDHFSEQICFVGHSHVPGVFAERSANPQVTRDERFIVNVGSVGQPRDGNPRLSFGILDTDRWEYTNVRLSYDIDTASKEILKAGLPRQLGERLFVGM